MTLTGGPYFPPGGSPSAAAEVFSLAGNRNGGYNPYVNSAFQHGGVVYFGWIDGFGNVEASTYTEATEDVETQRTIEAGFQVDAHDSPALCRRDSDGKIIAVYSKHNSTPINLRVASSANSVNGWSGATNLDSQLGGTRYTDYSLYEDDDTLYLFYRDEPTAGTDSRWCIATCDSSTPTSGWSAQTIVYQITSTRSYVKSFYDPANRRIHFAATNGANENFNREGHFYLDVAAGTYHKTDGTAMGSPPFDYNDLTEVYAGSTFSTAIASVNVDGSGHPVLLGRDTISSDMRLLYWRWDGAAWNTTNLASIGTGYEYNGTGTGFGPWGHALDSDPNVVWALLGSGTAQLWRFETANGGASFSSEQITTDLDTEHTQVIPVLNADKLRAMWQGPGTWTTYTSWNQVATGVRETT